MSHDPHTPPGTGNEKQFRRGLVVGKFSPLHRGHQLVIERALADCDEVLVISYSVPEFPRCTVAAREHWLAELFPQTKRFVIDGAGLAFLCAERGLRPQRIPHNDAGDEPHRQFCAWLCHDILHFYPDAVFTSEDYGDGFAAVLGACLTRVSGSARTIKHVCVDIQRLNTPISGTMLRASPHEWRESMLSVVYADFVERVCLLGAESSGKTTLAAALANAHGTTWVPEYGRELWIEKDGQLEFSDMLQIGNCQIAREQHASQQAARWLFCDTSPLTTVFYSEVMFGRVDERLLVFANRGYDRIWLCAPDFDFVQDGTRRDPAFREQQHAWYVAELGRRGLSYDLLSGGHNQRLIQANSLLELIKKPIRTGLSS